MLSRRRFFVIAACLVLACLKSGGALAEINIDVAVTNVKGWTIGYSNSLKGCLAAATYEDRTTVWIGFDGTQKDTPAYIAFTNPNWRSIEPRKNYELQIQALGYGNWRGQFLGFQRDKENGLALVGLKETFINDLARASGIVILLNQKVLTRSNLSGSSAAFDAVVQYPRTQSVSFGTGFVISSAGYVLTNHHVVKACSVVQLAGMDTVIREGEVMASDERDDLALVSTDLKPSIVPAFRTTGARIGENVWVYGFPLTGLLASSGNFTGGNISAVAGIGNDTRMLQISAPVQPGNSGGPLIDQYGNVVGVIVGKLDALSVAEQTHDLPQNVNFAIKSAIAVNFLESNGVRPSTASSTKSVEQADIADRARSFTVQIKCEPGKPASSKSQQKFAKPQPTAPAPNTPSLPQAVELTRTVAADQKFRLDFLYSLEADCSSVGFASVRVIDEPRNGKVTFENGTGFSNFSKENIRYDCNKRRTEGVILSYEPSSGYTGPDSFIVDVIYPSGNSGKRHYSIEVK